VKRKTFILYIIAVCLVFTVSFKFTEASIFSHISNGFNNTLDTIHTKISGDFCNSYNINLNNGTWKIDEIRSKFANLFCERVIETPKKNIVTKEIVDEKLSFSTSSIAKINTIEKITTVSATSSPKPLKSISENEGLQISSNVIVYWTNVQRKENNLSALIENTELSKIAEIRVNDMFSNSYFQHVSPTGDSVSKIADRSGVEYIIIGENIALGNFDSSRSLVDAWMNSEGHRANILNKNYTNIGVASIDGIYEGRKVTISAQVFDKPISDCPVINKDIKDQIDSYVLIKDNLKADINKIELALQDKNLSNAEYNIKIQQFNSIIAIYNNIIVKIKELADIYNKSVEKFNICIKIF
jgi:uncharacterized protein YkwD